MFSALGKGKLLVVDKAHRFDQSLSVLNPSVRVERLWLIHKTWWLEEEGRGAEGNRLTVGGRRGIAFTLRLAHT